MATLFRRFFDIHPAFGGELLAYYSNLLANTELDTAPSLRDARHDLNTQRAVEELIYRYEGYRA